MLHCIDNIVPPLALKKSSLRLVLPIASKMPTTNNPCTVKMSIPLVDFGLPKSNQSKHNNTQKVIITHDAVTYKTVHLPITSLYHMYDHVASC